MSDVIFVSIIEAARRLGVGRTSVFKLMASGRLKGVKVGRRTLVPVRALEDFAETVPTAREVRR
jgi:excisionase family DNA binding protein